MSDDINIIIYDEQTINVVMEDEQPVSVTIEDEQPIQVMIEGGVGTDDHNNLDGLQGGTIDEYYHLLATEYAELTEWLDNVTLGSNGVTTLPQLVLTPSAAAIEAVEGGIFYNSVNKAVYVCTEAA